MSTWLVTGGTGLLGVNLGRWLRDRTDTVCVARSRPPVGTFEHFESIDLLDAPAAIAGICALRPTVIVNAAALASHGACEADPQLAEALNADVAGTVAEAAAACGARLVHISTDAVFDGRRGSYSESDEPAPFSVYGRTKLIGEQRVLEAHPTAVCVRTNFFGWSTSGDRSILEFFVTALREGRKVPGYTDFTVTSLYAQHLADALFELATSPFSGLIHAGSSDPLTKFDFGRMVAEVFGLDAGLIEPSSSLATDDGVTRQRDLSLDSTLLRGVLGRDLPGQREGVLSARSDESRFRSST